MEFFGSLLVSITVVAIFSSIILNLVGEENSQREIVKISCGLLMIIVLLNAVNNGFSLDLTDYDNFYSDYNNLVSQAQLTYEQLELEIIQSEVEKLVLSQFGINCTVYFTESYEISRIIVDDNTKNYEISQLLGINENLIEYIENR